MKRPAGIKEGSTIGVVLYTESFYVNSACVPQSLAGRYKDLCFEPWWLVITCIYVFPFVSFSGFRSTKRVDAASSGADIPR